jgi:hypothetical protein
VRLFDYLAASLGDAPFDIGNEDIRPLDFREDALGELRALLAAAAVLSEALIDRIISRDWISANRCNPLVAHQSVPVKNIRPKVPRAMIASRFSTRKTPEQTLYLPNTMRR